MTCFEIQLATQTECTDNGIMLCGEETDLPDIASANASSLGAVQDDGCNSGANYEYKGRWLQRNECTSDDIKILHLSAENRTKHDPAL